MLLPLFSNAQLVSTWAGKVDTTGMTNAVGIMATFDGPHGVSSDKNGNLYVADRNNHVIRKITPAGLVSTFAGSGIIGSFDGIGSNASFYEPWAVACDTADNVYVADTKNYKIRKITPQGVVTTIAGTGSFGTTNGPAMLSSFGFPSGICVTEDGIVYIADHMTHTIRKLENGNVITLAGMPYMSGTNDGVGNTARFYRPYGICLDINENIIVADEWNHLIRQVSPTGNVSTIAGVGIIGSSNGQPMASMFNYPWDVSVDKQNNIYIADGYNFTIRKISSGAFPTVSTYAGQPGATGAVNGVGTQARFDGATGITFNPNDNGLYVADCYNQLIRKIQNVSNSTITLSSNNGSNTFCFGDTVILSSSINNLASYSWYKNGTYLFNTPSSSIIQIPNPGTSQFTCIGYDTIGSVYFSNSISIIVGQPPSAVTNPAGNVSICNGDSLLITSNTANSYLWSNGATTQQIFLTQAGNYYVTVSDSAGCKATAGPIIASISSGPAVTISALGDTTFCPGDSVILEAQGGATYVWSSGETTQNIVVKNSGAYTVLASDNFGCTSVSSSILVSHHPIDTASITPLGYVLLNAGNTVSLNCNNTNVNYLWSNGASTQNIMVNDSGTFSVTVTNSFGCSNQSPTVVVIKVTQGSIMNIIGSTTFCSGDSVLLSSNFSSGNQWFYNGAPVAGLTAQQIYAKLYGYYYVMVTQGNGTFIVSDSVLVNAMPVPEDPNISDTTICGNQAVLLQADNPNNDTYVWYNSLTGGSIVGNGNSFQSPILQNTTSYFIDVTGANGCKRKSRYPVNIFVSPVPVSTFNYSVSTVQNGYAVAFQSASVAGVQYLWQFGDTLNGGGTSFAANPTYTYTQSGYYTITLQATSSDGCSSTETKIVFVSTDLKVFIPTTFTPNSDGVNDIFRVRAPNLQNVEMKIFNQWGHLIYNNDNALSGWDGSLKGNTVQNGTYSYLINVELNDGSEKTFQGKISVIR